MVDDKSPYNKNDRDCELKNNECVPKAGFSRFSKCFGLQHNSWIECGQEKCRIDTGKNFDEQDHPQQCRHGENIPKIFQSHGTSEDDGVGFCQSCVAVSLYEGNGENIKKMRIHLKNFFLAEDLIPITEHRVTEIPHTGCGHNFRIFAHEGFCLVLRLLRAAVERSHHAPLFVQWIEAYPLDDSGHLYPSLFQSTVGSIPCCFSGL